MRVVQFFFDARCQDAMISFDDFCSVEGVPTYLQMIRHVKQGLAADVMQNGEKLLSRRLLSTTLAVNPNTAQKGYRQRKCGTWICCTARSFDRLTGIARRRANRPPPCRLYMTICTKSRLTKPRA